MIGGLLKCLIKYSDNDLHYLHSWYLAQMHRFVDLMII